MRMKRKVAWLLLITLLVTFLSGCTNATNDTKKVENSKTDSTKETEQNKEEKGTETVGYGRYVEEEVALPEKIQTKEEAIVKFCKNRDGKIEIYSTETKSDTLEHKHYELNENGSFIETELPWLKAEEVKDRAIINIHYGQDGKTYILVNDIEGKYWVYELQEDNSTLVELKIDKLDQKTDYGYYEPISDIVVFENGNYLLIPAYSPANYILYDRNTQKELFEIKEGASQPLAIGNKLYMVDSTVPVKLECINMETFEKEETFSLQEAVSQEQEGNYNIGGYKIDVRKGDGIYIASMDGLMYIGEGASKWELLMEPDMAVMGMPTVSLRELFCTTEGSIYLSYYDSNNYDDIKLVRYVYQDNIKNTRDKVLSIYSLTENLSIRQAMVLFQREHLDVKVEYRAIMEENTAATREDCIKALNTELLAGKGPDIIITDSMPLDSYIEKGVLEDITELINEIVEENHLLPNFVEAAKKDGKIYSMPTRFYFPAFLADDFYLKQTDSAIELAKAEQEGKPLFGKMNYMGLFDMLYDLYGDQISEGKELKEEKLKELLQAYSMLSANNVTEEEDNFYDNIANLCGGTGQMSLMQLDQGISFMLYQAAMNKTGYKLGTIRDGFYPKVSTAINKSSEQKELAEDFIKLLFSDEIQSADIDGLPMNPNGVEAFNINRNDNVAVSIRYMTVNENGEEEENRLEAEWPKEEEMRALTAIWPNLKVMLNPDETIRGMIQEEIEALYRKEKGVDEVTSLLMQKIKTYLSE